MRAVALIAGALALCGAAFAADSAAIDAGAEQVRGEYQAAIDRAVAIGETRWAFTLTYVDQSSDETKTYKLRFDPRRPSGDRWSAVEPPADLLSKGEKKAFKRISSNDDADAALVYDNLAETSADLTLISADATEAVFEIPVDDPEMPEKARAALVATARLDRKAGHVSLIEVEAKSSFKPALVARIDMLRQVQRFAPAGPGGEILLVSSDTESAGEAMMKSFHSKARATYSDFEPVSTAPRDH